MPGPIIDAVRARACTREMSDARVCACVPVRARTRTGASAVIRLSGVCVCVRELIATVCATRECGGTIDLCSYIHIHTMMMTTPPTTTRPGGLSMIDLSVGNVCKISVPTCAQKTKCIHRCSLRAAFRLLCTYEHTTCLNHGSHRVTIYQYARVHVRACLRCDRDGHRSC